MGTIKFFWEILLPRIYLFLYLTTGFLCLCGRDAPDEDGPAGTGGPIY